MNSQSLKAACYKCSILGWFDADKCVMCGFPLIRVPEDTDRVRRLASVFQRTSVRLGAPPLPGLDREKRKAQLLAESRQKNKIKSEPSDQQVVLESSGTSLLALQTRHWGTWLKWSALIAALALGVLVSVVQHHF